jgi:hypothetical protein
VLLGLVAPADVSPLLSLQLFVAVLLGGTARWWGPVLGVAVLAALPPLADAVASSAGIAPERTRGALTAALLVAVLAARGPLRRGSPGPPPWRRRLRPRVRSSPPTGLPGARPAARRAPVRVVRRGARPRRRLPRPARRSGPRAGRPQRLGQVDLLRVLAGDLEPEAGRVEVAGAEQPRRSSPQQRVRVGVARTPQSTVVPPLAPARQVAWRCAAAARPRTPSSATCWPHRARAPPRPPARTSPRPPCASPVSRAWPTATRRR